MTTTSTRALPAESEAQFQQAVIELAEQLGWRVAHFDDSRREIVDRKTGERKLVGDKQAAGFPDLVLVRDQRLIFAELKTDSGRVSAKQELWLFALSVVEEASENIAVHVWRPGDWRSIERTLARSWT